MPIFNDGNEIYHTDGSDIVWATTRRPALLLPGNAVTLTNFDISFPDLSKSNGYGFTFVTTPLTLTACTSFVTVNPQEWDSGQSYVCDLPPACNYFEVEMASVTRTVTPSQWLGVTIPGLLGSGQIIPDGNSGLIEGIGPLIRMFSFERSGDEVRLRRKQSVNDNGGPTVSWNSPNNNDNGSGGYRAGFTYSGDAKAWIASPIEDKSGGNVNKRRGEVNACSLIDDTNFASTWRVGTLTITPGYIKP